MLAVAVLDNDWPYSLEEAAEYLLMGISGLYPNGETVTKETGEKQLEVYYKTTVEEKDYMAGIQAQLVQNDEKMVGVLGLYEAEEEEKYKGYMDMMLEKLEY